MKKSKKSIELSIKRPSYESYAYTRDLIKSEMDKLTEEYRRSLSYLTDINYKKSEYVRDEIHKNYCNRVKMFKDVIDDHFLAYQLAYKDHPRPGMRKFWEIYEKK